MKVALMLKLSENEGRQKQGHVVVFRIESNKIVGVENETLSVDNNHELSFWAVSKKINEIYLPEVNEENKKIFTKVGVIIKGQEEMRKSKLFRNYIV